MEIKEVCLNAEYSASDHRWLQWQPGLILPQELGSAMPLRQSQYLWGRHLAAKAIQQLGGSYQPPWREERHPVWPEGVVGSISHSDHLVAAYVASSESIQSVGIDIEPELNSERAGRIKKRIGTAYEWSLLQSTYSEEPTAVTALFSAKEALYKCLNPLVKRFFGFHEAVAVAATPDQITFELRGDISLILGAQTKYTVSTQKRLDHLWSFARLELPQP